MLSIPRFFYDPIYDFNTSRPVSRTIRRSSVASVARTVLERKLVKVKIRFGRFELGESVIPTCELAFDMNIRRPCRWTSQRPIARSKRSTQQAVATRSASPGSVPSGRLSERADVRFHDLDGDRSDSDRQIVRYSVRTVRVATAPPTTDDSAIYASKNMAPHGVRTGASSTGVSSTRSSTRGDGNPNGDVANLVACDRFPRKAGRTTCAGAIIPSSRSKSRVDHPVEFDRSKPVDVIRRRSSRRTSTTRRPLCSPYRNDLFAFLQRPQERSRPSAIALRSTARRLRYDICLHVFRLLAVVSQRPLRSPRSLGELHQGRHDGAREGGRRIRSRTCCASRRHPISTQLNPLIEETYLRAPYQRESDNGVAR